jgi:hypothetical protein
MAVQLLDWDVNGFFGVCFGAYLNLLKFLVGFENWNK